MSFVIVSLGDKFDLIRKRLSNQSGTASRKHARVKSIIAYKNKNKKQNHF